MKKYKITKQMPKDYHEFLVKMFSSKLVYFKPIGRVISPKFFLGWTWDAVLVKYIEQGAFWQVEKYEDISRRRIRKILEECPTI